MVKQLVGLNDKLAGSYELTEKWRKEREEREQRIEAERVKTERIKAEREAERIEAERVKTERIEAERVKTERIKAERGAERKQRVMTLQARLAELKAQRVMHKSESKQRGLDTQVAPANEEIKAIEKQVEPQVRRWHQWTDTKATMVVISPATHSVPVQTHDKGKAPGAAA